MLRFIDLGNQICDDYKEFAWYDTVVDRFIEIYDSYTWHTWKEFESDCRKRDIMHDSMMDIVRFKRLFPDNWEK